jgi:hypothetical protein
MKRFVLTSTAILISSASILADLTVGQSYRISAPDADGNTLSTADGHVTTIVLTTEAGISKARAVGDHSPDFCLGNPNYRFVTVLAFEKSHGGPMRAILHAAIRHRLNAEGRLLQTRYDKLKIARDARHDVFAIPDFDGTITKQLGAEPAADLFRVFVFGKNGELIKEWSDVPSAEDLAATLK